MPVTELCDVCQTCFQQENEDVCKDCESRFYEEHDMEVKTAQRKCRELMYLNGDYDHIPSRREVARDLGQVGPRISFDLDGIEIDGWQEHPDL